MKFISSPARSSSTQPSAHLLPAFLLLSSLLPTTLSVIHQDSHLLRRQSPGSPYANSTTSGPPSPAVFPSPNVTTGGDWTSAVERARAFVAGLTLEEKVNITTGVDVYGRCVGNTGTIPRLKFEGFCLHDSPLGVRSADYVSAFPAGLNAGLTWDHKLIYERAKAMVNPSFSSHHPTY
jgi:hypothetical protein